MRSNKRSREEINKRTKLEKLKELADQVHPKFEALGIDYNMIRKSAKETVFGDKDSDR